MIPFADSADVANFLFVFEESKINITYFFLIMFPTHAEMDPQLQAVPHNYPSSINTDPLHFLGARAMTAIGQVVPSSCP